MNLFKRKISDSEAALATLQAEFDTLNANYGELQNTFKDSENMVATLNSQILEMTESENQLKDRISELETENATLTANASNVSAQAATIAINTLASIGVEPVETAESVDILAQLKALPEKDRPAFFKQHKNKLL